ncbi:hypothetical protein OK006_9445 [Actinobacteria bacterium OK006]|nr:hypothetical protein OK006_9445 [Actinobacteria bacterium OK006]
MCVSTPSGQAQQSSTATYSQAIRSLEHAKTRMNTIKGQVQMAKADLQVRYQGPDGQAYSRVMDTWLGEVDRIERTCDALENQLGNSMQTSNRTQSGVLQAVVDDGRLTAFGGSLAGDTYSAMQGG